MWIPGSCLNRVVLPHFSPVTSIHVRQPKNPSSFPRNTRGGRGAGWFGLGALYVGQTLEWWRLPTPVPYLFTLGYIGFVVSLAPFYLISWRLARRLGWIVFSQGIIPVVAAGGTYAGWAIIGHSVMRLTAGPARADAFRSDTRRR